MSLARIYTTKKSRKVWVCGKCHDEIPKGEKVLHFAVGFRGTDQHRCSKPGCFPKNSELESSLVSSIYAAQEDFDVSGCDSLGEIDSAVSEVSAVLDEVASEYEDSEMYEVNEDLQERAGTIRSAQDELENWESNLSESEPEQEDGESDREFQNRYDDWLIDARDAAGAAVNNMDLP
jgi:uncharacterized protein YukE